MMPQADGGDEFTERVRSLECDGRADERHIDLDKAGATEPPLGLGDILEAEEGKVADVSAALRTRTRR